MPFSDHILDNEKIQSKYTGKGWVWICTNYRLLRYKAADDQRSRQEYMQDVSFSEISSLRFTTEQEVEESSLGGILLAIGLLIGVFGIGARSEIGSGEGIAVIVFGGLVAVAGILELFSENETEYQSGLTILGSGILRENPWNIDTEDDDIDELREFAKELRRRI